MKAVWQHQASIKNRATVSFDVIIVLIPSNNYEEGLLSLLNLQCKAWLLSLVVHVEGGDPP